MSSTAPWRWRMVNFGPFLTDAEQPMIPWASSRTQAAGQSLSRRLRFRKTTAFSAAGIKLPILSRFGWTGLGALPSLTGSLALALTPTPALTLTHAHALTTAHALALAHAAAIASALAAASFILRAVRLWAVAASAIALTELIAIAGQRQGGQDCHRQPGNTHPLQETSHDTCSFRLSVERWPHALPVVKFAGWPVAGSLLY